MTNINLYLEHTNLKPFITDKDIDKLVAEAKEFKLFGVCVPTFWLKRAKREIGDADIRLVTVIGFPLGYQLTETRLEEIKHAIAMGADELDLVMNISAFKAGMEWFKIDIAKAAQYCHEQQKILKVIIETAYLSEEEIIKASKAAAAAGADFVKTSTGFAPTGATPEHIRLIKKHIPAATGIKASGGIKTLKEVKAMIDAGADRIGTSSSVSIMQEYLSF
jgi:deoxyribose-phosphate aldolase